MPSSPAHIARDQRILAGHAAGTTIPDLDLAEDVDPGVVRRVLRDAGIAPGPLRPAAAPASPPDRLADPARYAACESGVGIAEALGLAQSSVFRVLQECGVLRSHAEARRMQVAGRLDGGGLHSDAHLALRGRALLLFNCSPGITPLREHR
jgi:hypothetical protein